MWLVMSHGMRKNGSGVELRALATGQNRRPAVFAVPSAPTLSASYRCGRLALRDAVPKKQRGAIDPGHHYVRITSGPIKDLASTYGYVRAWVRSPSSAALGECQ